MSIQCKICGSINIDPRQNLYKFDSNNLMEVDPSYFCSLDCRIKYEESGTLVEAGPEQIIAHNKYYGVK